MPHIDYYFATISPSAYLAGTRLEAVAERHGAGIAYKPVDIMGIFNNMGGLPPGQRHPARQEMRLQELRRQAKKAGLPINLHPAHFPTNGAPAAYAIIAAAEAGGGDLGGLVHAVLRACWAEDKDIAQEDVIRACLAGAGFDPGLADRGLLRGAEVYERNLQDAIEAGAFGSPFYIVGEEKFFGQDRIEDLDLHLSGKL